MFFLCKEAGVCSGGHIPVTWLELTNDNKKYVVGDKVPPPSPSPPCSPCALFVCLAGALKRPLQTAHTMPFAHVHRTFVGILCLGPSRDPPEQLHLCGQDPLHPTEQEDRKVSENMDSKAPDHPGPWPFQQGKPRKGRRPCLSRSFCCPLQRQHWMHGIARIARRPPASDWWAGLGLTLCWCFRAWWCGHALLGGKTAATAFRGANPQLA